MKRDVYLYRSGELKRKDNTLVYIIGKEINHIPIQQLDHIHVFGECKFNKRVLEFLNKYNVSISYYTRYGNCVGRFTPNKYKDPKTLIQQVHAYEDLETRNRIIRSIIYGSIMNNLNLLKYFHNRKGINCEKLIDAIHKELNAINKLSYSDPDYSTQALLIEARSKQSYYQLFDLIISDSDFKFVERNTQPPLNPLNAMMSFGYNMLYSDLLCAIDQSDLQAEISFVHGHTHHTNGSLHFDLADLFKPQLIDRLCIQLILNKTITIDHFYKTTSNGIFLNEEGRKLYAKEYDRALRKTVIDNRNNKSYSYKQLLKREVNILKDAILQNKKYKTIYFKW